MKNYEFRQTLDKSIEDFIHKEGKQNNTSFYGMSEKAEFIVDLESETNKKLCTLPITLFFFEN